MRVTTHGNYLVQLTRLPRAFPVNCYFVREDDGLTLIDTGLPNSAQAIISAASKLGMPIRRIILTHAHMDHVASADELRRLLPDAEMLASARDARFLAGDMSLDPAEPQVKLRGSYRQITTRPDRLLSDGARIGSLQVVDSPGHTPGHIALSDRRDGTLIAGDAFQTRAGVAVSGTMRWLFPFPALATWHYPSALASARLLRSLDPSRLAVGHGDVVEQPARAMDQAIAEAARGLAKQPAHGT
jgi:glyoxylase-like metal-dependent hydrolase (beta-lactamase superfamily II)